MKRFAKFVADIGARGVITYDRGTWLIGIYYDEGRKYEWAANVDFDIAYERVCKTIVKDMLA